MPVRTERRAVVRVPRVAIQAERAERRLGEFIRQAWEVVEPAVPYEHNWHIDAICEYLEAATRGELRRLLITIPPRHMKSLSVSVFWPAWVWLRAPGRQWLYSSYAADLAITHAVTSRRLIESPWYRERWGDRFALQTDQNVKSYYENDRGGKRLSGGVGGRATGFGGDFVVCDDPHKIGEATSEQVRERTLSWWDHEMSTRLNDPRSGVRVVIQQRVHQGDLAGHLIEQGDWEHLCLPEEYEPKHPQRWARDPRDEPGELLWPSRYTPAWVEREKVVQGSYAWAGLYQQRPSPAEGGVLKRSWWRYYVEPPAFQQLVASWDMTFKDTAGTDYVVGQLWGRDLANKYLLAQIRARLDFPATIAAVRALAAYAADRFGDLAAGHAKLVEDKANGPAVMSTLQREVEGLIAIEPAGGKEARAHAVAPQVEAGNVHLPLGTIPAPPGYEQTSTEAFVDEAASFPRGAFDDQVDGATQALLRLASVPSGRAPVSGGIEENADR